MPSRLIVVLVSLFLATPAVIFCSSSYQNITAGVANSSFVLSLYTVPEYNHRPLLTALLPCSVPRSAQQALCPRLHNTCLRSSKHCDAHRGRSSLLLTSHKKIPLSDLWDKSWKQTLLRVALLRKAHF